MRLGGGARPERWTARAARDQSTGALGHLGHQLLAFLLLHHVEPDDGLVERRQGGLAQIVLGRLVGSTGEQIGHLQQIAQRDRLGHAGGRREPVGDRLQPGDGRVDARGVEHGARELGSLRSPSPAGDPAAREGVLQPTADVDLEERQANQAASAPRPGTDG